MGNSFRDIMILMNKETVKCSPLLLKCLAAQWSVHVSFIFVAEVLMTQWLVRVSFIAFTVHLVLVVQCLVHVSFIFVIN